MNRLTILKQLLPGFIPLLVFVAVDEIWGTRVGLFVALAVGIGELLITLIKEGGSENRTNGCRKCTAVQSPWKG